MRTWPRRLAAAMVALLVSMLLLSALGLWLAVQAEPLVAARSALSSESIGQFKEMLQRNDPRRGPDGQARHITLRQKDLDLLLHDGLHRAVQGAAQVRLAEGAALLQASLPLRAGPQQRLMPVRLLGWLGPWLNVSLVLRARPSGPPGVESLRVGALPLPGAVAAWLARQLARQLNLATELDLALGMIDEVAIGPGSVQVSYQWQPQWRDQMRAALVPASEQARIRAHSEHLTEWVAPSRTRPAAQPISLAELLPAMFEFANDRATAVAAVSGRNELAQEHRAALVTLAIYSAGQPMARLIPAARQWRQPHARVVTLSGREDFAQHFLVSAVLAAEGGGRLADMIGIYKEMADTRGGSGFSFNDIAADRAGTRFGQRAVQHPAALAARLGAGPLREQDLMPAVGDLPEFLTDAAFRQRFGSVGSPAYAEMIAQIEQRVADLAVLH